MLDNGIGDRPSEPKENLAKVVWEKPAINSVTPLADARGNGVAGTDFASELS